MGPGEYAQLCPGEGEPLLKRIQDNDRNCLVAAGGCGSEGTRMYGILVPAVAGLLRHGVHLLLSHLCPALGLPRLLY